MAPRLVGAESTHQTSAQLQEDLSMFCDSVHSDSFTVHPQAFLGWIRILVISYPFALIALWLSQPYISLLVLGLGIFIMVREFFLYYETIDRFYPKREGKNVYGIIDPQKEVERTVIYSGHHDSAKVFTFLADKPNLYLMKGGWSLGFICSF